MPIIYPWTNKSKKIVDNSLQFPICFLKKEEMKSYKDVLLASNEFINKDFDDITSQIVHLIDNEDQIYARDQEKNGIINKREIDGAMEMNRETNEQQTKTLESIIFAQSNYYPRANVDTDVATDDKQKWNDVSQEENQGIQEIQEFDCIIDYNTFFGMNASVMRGLHHIFQEDSGFVYMCALRNLSDGVHPDALSWGWESVDTFGRVQLGLASNDDNFVQQAYHSSHLHDTSHFSDTLSLEPSYDNNGVNDVFKTQKSIDNHDHHECNHGQSGTDNMQECDFRFMLENSKSLSCLQNWMQTGFSRGGNLVIDNYHGLNTCEWKHIPICFEVTFPTLVDNLEDCIQGKAEYKGMFTSADIEKKYIQNIVLKRQVKIDIFSPTIHALAIESIDERCIIHSSHDRANNTSNSGTNYSIKNEDLLTSELLSFHIDPSSSGTSGSSSSSSLKKSSSSSLPDGSSSSSSSVTIMLPGVTGNSKYLHNSDLTVPYETLIRRRAYHVSTGDQTIFSAPFISSFCVEVPILSSVDIHQRKNATCSSSFYSPSSSGAFQQDCNLQEDETMEDMTEGQRFDSIFHTLSSGEGRRFEYVTPLLQFNNILPVPGAKIVLWALVPHPFAYPHADLFANPIF